MATAKLTRDKTTADTSIDSVVIVKVLATLPGGRTLDVTGFADDEISAGHLIIEETSTGELKPLPVNGTLPGSHTYKGVLIASKLTSDPRAAIMLSGTVNEAYMVYTVPSGAKTALTSINFINA